MTRHLLGLKPSPSWLWPLLPSWLAQTCVHYFVVCTWTDYWLPGPSSPLAASQRGVGIVRRTSMAPVHEFSQFTLTPCIQEWVPPTYLFLSNVGMVDVRQWKLGIGRWAVEKPSASVTQGIWIIPSVFRLFRFEHPHGVRPLGSGNAQCECHPCRTILTLFTLR